jgi:hypothetical protein
MQKVEPLFKDNYLAFIRNSVGANTYRNLYALVDGERKDIAHDGELSCAIFASSILALFKLIAEQHATVNGTERDLLASGWVKIDEPRDGAVLVWEEISSDDPSVAAMHKHIGFYVGNDEAVSNSKTLKAANLHHWTFGTKNGAPVRAVEAIYWNEKLQ